ncbi:MAG TPA: glycosyltransferase family 39 protein [Burkholderiales bacterium]|nr:glycosyltransferase family 39 protein [Burkholderiales bacterium]
MLPGSVWRDTPWAASAAAVGLAILFAALWFPNLDGRKIIRPDEGRYAEIAREMAASGDWLTPRLNAFKYFEKPPLQYWATAAAFAAFGVDEWTARLWVGLTGFLGVLLTWYVANRLRGPPAGLYAAAVLGSATLYVVLGHLNTLDMGLSFFLSATVFAIALAQRDAASEGERRRWMLVAWGACAAATLSKGLIGIVLPAGAVVLYALVHRDATVFKRLNWRWGLAVFLTIGAPWFIAVSAANPEFARFFFYHEHVERFLTTVHGREESLWYFVPVVLAGMMPWTLALLPALRAAWTAAPAERFRPERFLLVWVATVFLFFSISGSKLPPYVLPMWPALAVVLGAALPGMNRRWLLAQAALCAVIGVAAALIAPSLPMRGARPEMPAELLTALAPWAIAAGSALAAGALIAALAEWQGRRGTGVAALALGGLAFAQLGLAGHDALSPVSSAYHSAAQVKKVLRPNVPFYSVEVFDHSLPFYLGRTVTLVVNPDELAESVRWEPENFIPDFATFEQRWHEDGDAFAMFSPSGFERAKQRGLPMVVIASDPRRVIVRKP